MDQLDNTCVACKTIAMPRAKKSTKRSAKKSVSSPALSKAYESEISYETKIIITVLLLIFVYPIGLIIMWWWMKDWPFWLKLLLSIPLFLGVLLFIGGFVILGTLIDNMHYTRQRFELRQHMLQREMQLTTTPAPTLLPTTIPTSPVTY